MNKCIKKVMLNSLKAEEQRVLRTDEEISIKMEKLNDIINLLKIIEEYDELQPVLKEYFDRKAELEKWER